MSSMTALTTHKALLTALRTRMKDIKPRSPLAQVTVTFRRDALSLDALTIPAEVPAAAVGTSCTLNGFLLLELLRKKMPTTTISLHVTTDDHLGLESGSFQIAFRPSALTRPAIVSPETQQVHEPAPVTASAPTARPAKRKQPRRKPADTFTYTARPYSRREPRYTEPHRTAFYVQFVR